jgi:hypothetical protein
VTGRRSLAVAAALLLLGTGAAAAGTGLVGHTSRVGAYNLKLPAGWHYRNASYPSDHTTEYWTAPGDTHSRLEVQVSGCVGCVEPPSCVLSGTHCHADPGQLVPKGTVSKTTLSRWRVEFVAHNAASPYPERGLVIVRHHGSTIVDWAYVQLWLPASQATLARTILASFAFT